MSFNRWESIDKYTYVYKLFNRHHTFMNSIYWAHAPVFSYTQSLVSSELKSDCSRTTHQFFNLSGSNSERVAQNLTDWRRHFKEFDNWTRLNALVSLSSYFETYLSSVVSLAIESDLGVLHGVPKLIDGVRIIKYGNEDSYSFFDVSEKITKGEWSKRRKYFTEFFGVAPVELTTYESELEEIRIIRNNVAHAFGRDIDLSRSRKTFEVIEIDRISIERLQKYMSIIRKVARAIDSQLLNNHIGDYEIIFYYHLVKDELDKKNKAYNVETKVKDELYVKNQVRNFKPKVNSLYFKQRGNQFCKELVDYYEKL
ncbi:TPA: hypothetical protein ACLBZ1_002328 [Bacillus cereus]